MKTIRAVCENVKDQFAKREENDNANVAENNFAPGAGVGHGITIKSDLRAVRRNPKIQSVMGGRLRR
jgi:hypothetical protein